MKSNTLISTSTLSLALTLATFACSTAADAPAGGGGQPGTGGSAASAGAGTVGGGSSAGAGNTSAAGAMNAAGAPGVSGAAGAATGGAPSAGSGGSSGGSIGTAGAAAGAAPVVDTTLVGKWDGALLQYPCGNSGTGYDCAQPADVNCKNVTGTSDPLSKIPPAGGVPNSWTMGGETGKVYSVTFNVRGVVEVNSFKGTVRAAGTASIAETPRNLFAVGGTAPVNGDGTFDYNVYALTVDPPVTGEANIYYLNSVTEEQNPHAPNTPTVHKSFDVKYAATIKVLGGSKVTLTVTDSNCVQIQNCGDSTNGNCVSGARSVDLAGATPQAPAFAQPPAVGGRYGQWVFFDITSVVAAP